MLRQFLVTHQAKKVVKATNQTMQYAQMYTRAYIHALSAYRYFFYANTFGETAYEIIDNPLSVGRDTCIQHFNEIALVLKASLNSHQKIAEIIHKEFPDLADDYKIHAKCLGTSLSIWQATISCGIAPSTLPTIQNTWKNLIVPETLQREAIQDIKYNENKISETTSQHKSLSDVLENDEWFDLCLYIPHFLRK